MNNKAHLRPKDFDSNGDIIPMACKEEKGDTISRSALKEAFYKEECKNGNHYFIYYNEGNLICKKCGRFAKAGYCYKRGNGND